MSNYGIDFYGAAFYGATQLVSYDASPFLATPNDALSLHLTWTTPNGNWTRMRLVRNGYGYPINESDGLILFDINSGPLASGTVDMPRVDYTDTGLTAGKFYYYTLFVYGLLAYNGRDDWRRAGNVTGLAVQDWGYTDKLNSLLPTVYTTDLNAVASQSYDADTLLYRFLSLIGFQLNYTRSQLETLQLVNDPSKVAGGLLPLMANQYGLHYEPELGMAQLRVLLRNIIHIYKLKGTNVGVQALINAFTGWGSQVIQGANLMLDYNDSSCEESIGQWLARDGAGNVSNCTLVRYPSDGTIAAFSTGLNKTAGLLQMTSTTNAVMSATCGGPINITFPWPNTVLNAIPVTPGQQYTFSFYARAAATTRSVRGQINYYTSTGATAGATIGTNVSDAVGSWTRSTTTGTAPSTARYAAPQAVVFSLANAEVHYIDAAQLEVGNSATTYQEARDLRIVLLADRVNEVTNPSFETNTTGWTSTGGTTIARSFAQGLYGAVSRTDAANTTAGSATVTDASILATDRGRPVSGPGIPANSYVGAVTPGVSFQLSSFSTFSPPTNIAALTGAGTLTAKAGVPSLSGTASLTGAGTLTAAASLTSTATATATGVSIVIGQMCSLLVTTDGVASAPYTTTAIVSGFQTYTVSCWVYGPAGNYQISHSQSAPVAGASVIAGPLVAVSSNTWTQISAVIQVPTIETAARWSVIGPASSAFYVDGVMVERGSVLKPYFDASLVTTHPADYLWEGTAHASRSHYYSNRTAKTFRLSALIGDYLWSGMTFTLLVAQPGT